jgi:hypothetical protein
MEGYLIVWIPIMSKRVDHLLTYEMFILSLKKEAPDPPKRYEFKFGHYANPKRLQ